MPTGRISPKTASQKSGADKTELTEKDNGASIRIKAGQKITVTLPTAFGSTYEWKTVGHPLGNPVLDFVGDGKHVASQFTWDTGPEDSGKHDVKLQLQDTGPALQEVDGNVAKTFKFTVDVEK